VVLQAASIEVRRVIGRLVVVLEAVGKRKAQGLEAATRVHLGVGGVG
jgi:hypothetical protein